MTEKHEGNEDIWAEIDALRDELSLLKERKEALTRLSGALRNNAHSTAALLDELDQELDGRGTE